MKVAILDDYLGAAREVADWSEVEARATVTAFRQPFASPDETVAALAGYDVLCLMRDRTPLSAQTLARLPDVKLITFNGRGNATLDIAAARAQGIAVARGERNRQESTSELIWALIMATVRQLPANDASLRAGTWQHSLGTTLYGKTIGIVGLGKLGRRIAGYAQAFGMSVIAWSPHLTPEAAAEAGAVAVTFDELLSTADVVTVHVALNDGTRGLIGSREIGLMRPSAYLINTSRGPIVDATALVVALTSGAIAGAGLDVYDVEPVPAGDPLLGAPNTVLLPHIGFVSRENMLTFYEDTVENVVAWLNGSPIHLVE
ncbi:MAG TPA: D-2-hydroxyacid dehydrogenase family protein [Micromonosporaceae bacterium]